jgi:hypothetical protein
MSQYLCESVAFDRLYHNSSLRADKSTQVQRKHSFQANLDFTYRIRVFQSSRYRPVFCQKTSYGSNPPKKLGKPIFVPDSCNLSPFYHDTCTKTWCGKMMHAHFSNFRVFWQNTGLYNEIWKTRTLHVKSSEIEIGLKWMFSSDSCGFIRFTKLLMGR